MIFSLWQRLPVIIRAILTGLAVALVGTTPWALLVSANQKYLPAIPWAVPPTILYLWLFWKYVNGKWWPQTTSEIRRAHVRANSLSGDVWGPAILAGITGLVAVLLLLRVMNRLVNLPQQQAPDISHIPGLTMFCFLLAGSAVAGIVEEAAFRGYMQGPIERYHGPVVAILVTGLLFGFMHFSHPEVTLMLMPYYVSVSAVYGTLAYLTNSIWPSMVLHAGGNVLTGFDLFTRGQSEWQASPSPEPLIWETGTDASFWISCTAVFVVGALPRSGHIPCLQVSHEKRLNLSPKHNDVRRQL